MKKEALRVTTTIPAAPTTLYYAWLNSDEHSQMTGATAKVDGNVGGKFTAQNGYVSGKLVVLDLGRRLLMHWRTNDFPRDAHDSRVEIHLEALGGISTRVTLLHTEIPEGQSEKCKSVWNDQYFTPMRAFFSKFLPDPRNPPPPRRPPPPPEDDDDEDEEEVEEAPVSKKPVKAEKKLAPPPASAKPTKAEKAEKPPKPAPKAEVPAKAEKKADKPVKKAPKVAASAKAEKKGAEKKNDKKAAKADKVAKKADKKADKKAAKKADKPVKKKAAKADKKADKGKPSKKAKKK